jgi:predicted esterase
MSQMNQSFQIGKKSKDLHWKQSGEELHVRLPLDAVCFQASEQILSICIMLHGFGDDAQNFIGLAQELALPGMLCVALDAPLPLQHMGLAEGKAWFDLFSNPWADIESAREKVTASVESLLEVTRLPSSKLVFCGFSQGGFMSLLCGLSWPTRQSSKNSLASVSAAPGAVVSLSGFLMGAHKLAPPVDHCKNIPLFIGHGRQDQVVLPLWYFETIELLKNAGYEKIQANTYNAAHNIDPQEMRDLKNFLKGSI